MRAFYFYGKNVNREINKENVKNLYYAIKKYGFLPQAGKIKKVINDDPDAEIYRVSVRAASKKGGLSINNFVVELIKEDDVLGKPVTTDGQHKEIACFIMEKEGLMVQGEKFEYSDDYEETVEIPAGMSACEFVHLLNFSKPWAAKDFPGKLKTGNKYLDYMDDKIANEDYKPDFIYSLYTLRTDNINNATIRALKSGRTDKMPKGLILNRESQDEGDQLLAAFDVNISRDAYNNGKLGKGFKRFVKENGGEDLDIDTLVDLIKGMGKDIWFEGERPEGSPEAPDYCKNFVKWYNCIYSDPKGATQEAERTSEQTTEEGK